jgi:uncharacterized protein (TIGR01615 family)
MKFLSWLPQRQSNNTGSKSEAQSMESERKPSGSSGDLLPAEIPVVVNVIRAVQACYALDSMALSLAVGSILRDACKMTVRLYVEMPAIYHVPPKWFEGVLTVTKPGSDEIFCVVDFNFKQKFMLARNSMMYSSFAHSIPEIFAGTHKDLEDEIDRISVELINCLQEHDLHVPPWRTPDWLKNMYRRCFACSPNHGEQLLNCIQESVTNMEAMRICNSWSNAHSSAIFAALTVRMAFMDRRETFHGSAGIFPSMSDEIKSFTPQNNDEQQDDSEEYYFEKVASSPNSISPPETRSGLSLLLE